MNISQKKNLLLNTSNFLIEFLNGRLYGDAYSIRLLDLIEKAPIKNPFFTVNEVTRALQSIAFALNERDIDEWFDRYKEELDKPVNPKKIGVIMAGNIPFVGWHDLICVLISGNDFIGKQIGRASWRERV